MCVVACDVVVPGAEVLDRLDDLIERDLMLDVWEIVEGMGPLRCWENGRARRMASLIADRLGDSKLSRVLDYLNFRDDRKDAGRRLRQEYNRLNLVPIVELLDDYDLALESDELTPKQRADYHLLRGLVFGSLGDHLQGREAVARAKELAPEESWTYVRESHCLEMADEYEAALEAVDRALELKPLYHVAVQQKVSILTHLGRDEDAIELLLEMHERTQHAIFVGRLQVFYREREDYERGLWCLDEYVRLSPLLDKKGKQWVAARRSDFLYLKGDCEGAIAAMEESGSEYYKRLVGKLRGAEGGVRRRLEVPFVRQHVMTCAPATLAALSLYWGEAKEHLEIAEAICYDGTPWHKEVAWCRDQGFLVRSFKVTWGAAKALIDRGVPFTLTTSWVTGAHLQACIGYDELKGVLIIRDPTHRHYGEFLMDELAESHPVQGPRGMLFLPKGREALVADLFFEGEQLYEAHDEMMVAIDAHDELGMLSSLSAMRAIGEDHPLTIYTESIYTDYRQDAVRTYELIEMLHRRFPENESWRYRFLKQCSVLESDVRRLALLEEVVAGGRCDPIFYVEMGDLLVVDLSRLEMANYYLRKAARRSGCDARSLASLGRCARLSNDRERAVKYARFASCKAGGFEGYAREYFHMAIGVGRVEEGLDYLRVRLADYGRKDSAPWLTYVSALEMVGRDVEAKRVCEEALVRFPNDGDLLMKLAMRAFTWGGDGEVLMLRARGSVSEESWQISAAKFELIRGNRMVALRHWKRVTELNERGIEGHQGYVNVLAEEFGNEEAVAYVEGLVERFPDSAAILELCAEWQSLKGAGESIEVLERLLSISPNNLWAGRELAIRLYEAGERERGLEEVERVLAKQPHDPDSGSLYVRLMGRAGRVEEAKCVGAKVLAGHVNRTEVAGMWMSLVDDSEEALGVLARMEGEIYRQASGGVAVDQYRELAFRYIDPGVLLEKVQVLKERHCNDWEAWMALKNQLLRMDRTEGARVLMEEMVSVFPYVPRVWVEVAEVRRAMGNRVGEVDALRKGLGMSPSWDFVGRKLSEALEWLGRVDEAVMVMREMVRLRPMEGANYGVLADLLGKQGKRGEAFELLLESVRRDATYEWGWTTLAEWALDMDRKGEVEDVLLVHDARRRHLASWWLTKLGVVSAWNVDGSERERIWEYLEKGLGCEPEEGDLLDWKASMLVHEGRAGEAYALADAANFASGKVPNVLRVRVAKGMWEEGRYQDAVKEVQDVVRGSTGNVLALRVLTNWLVALEKWEEARKVCEEWLRYQPEFAVVWGQRALICQNLGQEKLAYRYYRRAYDLSAEYSFAGLSAFDLGMKLGVVEELGDLVRRFQHYTPGFVADSMVARLAYSRGDRELALASLGKMVESKEGFVEEYRACDTEMGDVSTQMVKRWVDEGRAGNSAALCVWLWGRSFPQEVAKMITKLPYSLEMKVDVWADFLFWISGMNEGEEVLKLWRKYKEHRGSNRLWALWGRVLVELGYFKECFGMMRDYGERKDLEGWMLLPLAHSLVGLNRVSEAVKVHEIALKELKPDGTLGLHYAYGALDLAILGRTEEARDLLEGNQDEFGSEVVSVGALTEMVIKANEGTRGVNLMIFWNRFVELNSGWVDHAKLVAYVWNAKCGVKKYGGKWPRTAKIPGIKFNMKILWGTLLIVLLVLKLVSAIGGNR